MISFPLLENSCIIEKLLFETSLTTPHLPVALCIGLTEAINEEKANEAAIRGYALSKSTKYLGSGEDDHADVKEAV